MLILALYYVTFQCRHKIFFGHKKLKKKHLKKLLTYGSWEVFFLCNPYCPKQPRTSFPFYKLFYATILCSISAYSHCNLNLEVLFSCTGFTLCRVSLFCCWVCGMFKRSVNGVKWNFMGHLTLYLRNLRGHLFCPEATLKKSPRAHTGRLGLQFSGSNPLMG